jgi:hypothetical protein
MKRTIITLAAGIALGAAAVAAPALSSSKSSERALTARIGDNILIPSIDLFCTVNRNDADHHEAGPLVSCARWSTKTTGRRTEASRYHFIVSTANGQYIAYRVARTP